jgi:hypothetical protein
VALQRFFLLDATDLSLNDVSGTTYTTTENWRFTQFGSYLIAANGHEPLQYYDMDASTTFANLDAAAPTSKFVTVCPRLCSVRKHNNCEQRGGLVGH